MSRRAHHSQPAGASQTILPRTSRRTTLLALAGASIGIGATARPAFAALPHRPDPRLLGTWHLDLTRTMRTWQFSADQDAAQRRDFEQLIGSLSWRFTPTRLHGWAGGSGWTDEYRVVDADGRSVVLAYEDNPGYSLQQIFFDSPDAIYVVSGYSMEFFRRAVGDELR